MNEREILANVKASLGNVWRILGKEFADVIHDFDNKLMVAGRETSKDEFEYLRSQLNQAQRAFLDEMMDISKEISKIETPRRKARKAFFNYKKRIDQSLRREINGMDLELASDIWSEGYPEEEHEVVILRTFHDPSVGIFGSDLAYFIPALDKIEKEEENIKEYCQAYEEAWVDVTKEELRVDIEEIIQKLILQLGMK